MPALVYSSRRCFFQYDNWQPISTPHSQHGISQKARKVVFILTASSNSLFDISWAMPHTTSDVQSTPIYDQLQSAIIRNDQHDKLLSATPIHSTRSYDQSDGSPLPPSRPGPLAYYWTLLSNPPVLYKFQQPPCVSLRRRSTGELSIYPTTQLLNHQLSYYTSIKISNNPIAQPSTILLLYNYQNIQQPNCLTIHDSNGVSTTSCAYSASLYYQW